MCMRAHLIFSALEAGKLALDFFQTHAATIIPHLQYGLSGCVDDVMSPLIFNKVIHAKVVCIALQQQCHVLLLHGCV